MGGCDYLILTQRAGLLVGESCLQWPPWMRCLCTSSSADGSVQKWSAVFIFVYSKAHGPTAIMNVQTRAYRLCNRRSTGASKTITVLEQNGKMRRKQHNSLFIVSPAFLSQVRLKMMLLSPRSQRIIKKINCVYWWEASSGKWQHRPTDSSFCTK